MNIFDFGATTLSTKFNSNFFRYNEVKKVLECEVQWRVEDEKNFGVGYLVFN